MEPPVPNAGIFWNSTLVPRRIRKLPPYFTQSGTSQIISYVELHTRDDLSSNKMHGFGDRTFQYLPEAGYKDGIGLLGSKKYPDRHCREGLHDKLRQDNGCVVYEPCIMPNT